MEEVLEKLRNARRKVLWRFKPMWALHASATEADLDGAEGKVGAPIPADLRTFLLQFGFGDLNDELSFRRDWFSRIEYGPLVGHVVFGQDDRGNLYTADPGSGAVHYIDRFEPGYARLAPSFAAFLAEAAARGFNVVAWAESNTLEPYPSAA